jgi:hypothetical protein
LDNKDIGVVVADGPSVYTSDWDFFQARSRFSSELMQLVARDNVMIYNYQLFEETCAAYSSTSSVL